MGKLIINKVRKILKSKVFFYVFFSAVSFLLFAYPCFGQNDSINHWETLVRAENLWRYTTAENNPVADWISPDFDDSSWTEAAGGIGYGDNDDSTVISSTIALFMRKEFYVFNPDKIERLLLHIDYDDAFIAYLNGREIARSNGLYNPLTDIYTPSSVSHEAMLYQGLLPSAYEINNSLLNTGINVLAIEVHNVSYESSDLTAITYLSAGISDTITYYNEVPDWFFVPDPFVSSNLPIFVIDTYGQKIPDEPKITAHMGVIYNGQNMANHIDDGFNEYNGDIGIEVRGESSQFFFPKKSYGIETRYPSGENNNVSLLDMPEENDWVLYAPFSDKSLLRNVITYELAREFGQYCSRWHYCELILNGSYEGIYILFEKIKRDENRIDIAKLEPDENSGDDLTGGYIIRVDKTDNVNLATDGWYARPNPSFPNSMDIYFQYYTPKHDEITNEQKEYIQGFIDEFELALISMDFNNQETGYPQYIDVPSFVNTFIINELSKDIDAYRYSMFFYKDKDSKNGKMVSGPFWDYNLGYGNVDYGYEGAQYTDDWLYDFVEDHEWSRMFWWKRLMQDTYFRDHVKTKWVQLRNAGFSNESIASKIDAIAENILEAAERNFVRWDVIGLYVWPNYYVGNSFNDEINYLKEWMIERAEWMDLNLPGTILQSRNMEISDFYIRPFPNPFKRGISFSISNSKNITSITISDINGRRVKELNVSTKTPSIIWNGTTETGRKAGPGMYFYSVWSNNNILTSGRIVKTM